MREPRESTPTGADAATSSLIPTTYRHRLPGDLSYPASASVVSAALAGIRRFTDLTLDFWDRPTLHASEFKRLLASSEPWPVFEAEYVKFVPGLSGRNDDIESGYFEPHWRLTIYAVPRPERRRVAPALGASGLPLVRAWLEVDRSAVWLQGSHSLTVLFAPDTATIATRES